MKKITLKIKAADILENNYLDARKCPITKAFARAGFPDLQDGGGIVGVNGGKFAVTTSKEYERMHNKMCSMFKYINPENSYGEIPPATEPKDFQATFEIDI